MNQFRLPDGTLINPETGDVLGVGEPAKIGATQTGSREVIGDVNIEKPAGKQAADALYQMSWGFNSLLFSLPDEVIKSVGRAAGVAEEEIPTFTRYFNRGQVAPENMLERFALNISKGVAAGLPLTGLLGYLSTTKALTGPLTANAGTLKRVAKDMLDFVRKDPAGAVKADLAFGGIYGGLEQSVEEFMDPGEYKDVAKTVIPMAGIFAVPTMLGLANKVVEYSPTGAAVRAVRGEAGKPVDFSRDEIVQQIVGEKTPKIPGLNWALGKVAGYNERQAGERVAEILKPLNDPAKANVQDAMRITRELEDFIKNDPRLKDLGLNDRFLLDLAQMSLDGSVLAARNELIKNISGKPLVAEQLRQADLEKVFLETFQTLAPKSPMQIDQALRAAYADHMNTVATAAKQVKTATEDEALMFADRFKAANMDDLGNWFRDSMFTQMEITFNGLKKEASKLGVGGDFVLGQKLGVPLPVRDEMGRPKFQYQAAPFRDFAQEMVDKYKLVPKQRIYVGEGVPFPIRYMNTLLNTAKKTEDKNLELALRDVVTKWHEKDLKMLPPGVREYIEESDRGAARIDTVVSYILGKTSERTARAALEIPMPSRFKYNIAESLHLGGAKDKLKDILPTDLEKSQFLAQARSLVPKQAGFQITFPEAVNMLEQSMRYRNSAIREYNNRIDLGTTRKDTERLLDVANQLHKDVEKFVFTSFGKSPELRGWLDKYEATYRDGYEKAFPLLITKKRAAGDFLLPSERVVQNALSSADNVRTMNVILGQDNAKYQQSLLDAISDKAYRAGVLDKDGLLDQRKYERFLQTNKNIIEAMPNPVQEQLRDYKTIAESSSKRLNDLRQRAEDVQDVELVQALKKAVRPDADPQKLVMQAVEDPAIMRKIVDSLANQPGQLEAMRRQVWLGVEKKLFDTKDPAFLEDFIRRNSKSLNILYDPQHLDDLRVVAEMQKRVFAGDPVTGKLSPFLSVDQKLRQTIGAGIGTVEATARAATIRQISTFHAGVSLLTRLATRQQTNAYEAVLYRALTDSKYAHQLVNATAPTSSPRGIEQQLRLASKAGQLGPLARALGIYGPAMARVAGIEATQALEDETRQVPVRQAVMPPASTMPQTPRMPPAPAALGQLSQSPAARTLPKMPSQGEVGSFADYARMFPQDFVSPLIQQRQQP